MSALFWNKNRDGTNSYLVLILKLKSAYSGFLNNQLFHNDVLLMSKANKAKRKKKEETFRWRGRGGLGGQGRREWCLPSALSASPCRKRGCALFLHFSVWHEGRGEWCVQLPLPQIGRTLRCTCPPQHFHWHLGAMLQWWTSNNISHSLSLYQSLFG